MPQVQVFNAFKEVVAEGGHDLGADALKLALSNTAPSLANAVLADITQISPAGGYVPATATVTSSSQTGGVYSLVLDAVTFTASGAAFDTFRYVVLYNDTATSDDLIAFFDYGAPVDTPDGSSFSTAAGTWLTND